MTKLYIGNRREKGEDFFETPRHAVEAIRTYIPEHVSIIWEPTYGKGAIGRVLEEWGYVVIKTDKYPKTEDTVQCDFLTDDRTFSLWLTMCDMIIFNPPFSYKTEFLQRVLETGKPFLFICPITIMETRTRFNLFREHELSVLNLPNRVNYLGKGDGKNKVFFHSVWVMKHPDYKNQILYAAT